MPIAHAGFFGKVRIRVRPVLEGLPRSSHGDLHDPVLPQAAPSVWSLGLVALLIGLGISIWLVVDWFQGRPLNNRPLFLAGIFLVIVGIQFISIGLLGEMITKSQRSSEEYAIREFIR